VNVARKVLSERKLQIPVVGVVKDERHRPREIIGDKEFKFSREKEILLANSEAHRFAITYLRKRVRGRFSGNP
jgi:excinuclease ABC subunit C